MVPPITAAPNLIVLGQHTIQHCWSIFIFISLLQDLAKSTQSQRRLGGPFQCVQRPLWSVPDETGQAVVGCTGIGGFTGLCFEHLLCCSEAPVTRGWERGSSGNWDTVQKGSWRVDLIVFSSESADIGRKLLYALLPSEHWEELGERAPQMPQCLPLGWLQRQWEWGCLRNVPGRGG